VTPRAGRRRPGLAPYEQKRNFERTKEPRGTVSRNSPSIFVVQRHAARHLHFDFRLELDGVLKSWAVPKGPSAEPGAKRLAVQVEDHPVEYASFEGRIPEGSYGAGTVEVWDRGTWVPDGDPHDGLREGKLTFTLRGKRLRGKWSLLRMRTGKPDKPSWLLVKRDDEAADTASKAKTSRRPNPITALSPKRLFSRPIDPQLATLVSEAPATEAWIHEPKLDGVRMFGYLERGAARLITRNGTNWTARFPKIVEALTRLPARQALFDGEIVALDDDGRSSFQALQRARAPGQKPPRVVYYVFDLLHLDGRDLTPLPLEERKKRLAAIAPRRGSIRYVEHEAGAGPEIHRAACARGLEGIVSKLRNAPYRPGRTREWVKTKCHRQQEFVIVGYEPGKGARERLGALHLAVHGANGDLRFVGKVGTGFDQATIQDLLRRFSPLQRAKPPIVDPPRGAAARTIVWLAPQLVAEVRFQEWTHEGRLRQPSYLGLREDKPPEEVRREIATPAPSQATKAAKAAKRNARVKEEKGAPEEVTLTHPDKLLYPEAKITKRDLAEYYRALAPAILREIEGRPLSLVRCPSGWQRGCFYQKHVGAAIGGNLPSVAIRERSGNTMKYPVVSSAVGLITLAQMGVLEIHPWGARADDVDAPDRLTFDLDPGTRVSAADLANAARAVRAALRAQGLESWLKTTGGKGLHVVCPLLPVHSWEEVHAFAKAIAELCAGERPRALTTSARKEHRPGKIFIDYLRNTRGATAVAAYSPRARRGAPVAMPITWQALGRWSGAPVATVAELSRRRVRSDAWKDMPHARQRLPRSKKRG